MVQKLNRSRGRPRHFDEEVAVRMATEVFWAKGFDAATVDDLVAAMGVQRPSLYAVFGDKSALFIRCLQAYLSRFGKPRMEALESAVNIAEAIRTLLRSSIENATGKKTPAGCLFVNVAPLVNDASIRAYLKSADEETRLAVSRRFQHAIADGELPAAFPCESRARLTLHVAQGSVLRAKLGVSREELLRDASDQVSLILSH